MSRCSVLLNRSLKASDRGGGEPKHENGAQLIEKNQSFLG